MNERVNTGGLKIFRWNSEDSERIRSTDTESTQEFKDKLREQKREKSPAHPSEFI